MQSVFGIAKNVNGRRVATAYHLGGNNGGNGSGPGARLPGTSNSTSTTATSGEQQHHGHGSSALDGMTLPNFKSSLTSSLSSSSLASLGGLESGSNSGSNSRLGTPTANGGNAEMARLNSSPFINAKTDQDQDWHVSKHGSVVDKTNPFIGYFQTGRDSPSSTPRPSRFPPRSTSGTGTTIREVATPYAALLNQPKRIADWIGSQSTRLPSLFTKREQGDKQSSTQSHQQYQQQGDKEEVKGLSLLSSLKAAATSLGGSSKKDTEQRSYGKATLFPQPEFSLKTAAPSRLEQDFELVESLGQGGQGTVFKARSKVDGCFYAIKKVALSNTALDDVTELEQARREAVSMAAIPPHSNVVRYHTAWIEVEPVESITSSTASVRGSDVPDDDDLGSEHSVHANEDDVSFSVASSVSEYVNFENSFGGFEFEDASRSMMSFTNEKEEDASSSDSEQEKLSGVGKSKLTLYIQMELCGTSVDFPLREEETFDRFVNRLKQKTSPPRQEHYSNLTQWLRSSVDERSSGHISSSAKHAEGLKLFLGVAQGVSHMHSVGVIHRDLKPDNIFIHGEVAKVGDFGLSKSIFADSRTLAQQGRDFENGDEYGDHTTALGTFTYASPEQLGHRFNRSKDTSRVKSAKYSIKSDIFALGVILLELCCPFGTMMERSQVLTAVRHGVVPQKALQRYPTEMALVLRMTAVDPAERPTADEICEQIRSLLITRNAISARSALDEFRDLQARPPSCSALHSTLPSGQGCSTPTSPIKDELHLSADHHQLARVAQLEYSPQKPTAPDENRQQAAQEEQHDVRLDLTPDDNPAEHQAVHELEALSPRELQDDGNLRCKERQHDRHGVHGAEAKCLSHRRRERVQREHPADPEPRSAHERTPLVPGEKVHDAHMRRRDRQRQEDEVERCAEEDEQLALVAREEHATGATG